MLTMPFPLLVLTATGIASLTLLAGVGLSRWRWLAVVAVFAGAFGLLLVRGPATLSFFVDDSFITFRYSQHLADGMGPNWNTEGRVEGYTNFLWMATLAGMAKLGLDIVDAALVLSYLSMGATYFFVYKIWRLWCDDDHASGLNHPVALAVPLLLLALNPGVAFWAFSGMETPLFMALITAGAYFHYVETRRAGLPWSAVILAAAAMTRPEGLVAAAVTGLFKTASLASAEDRGPAIRNAARWAAVFLLLYGSYFLWRYTYYDYLLPNTFYAKVDLSMALVSRGFDYLYRFGVAFHVLLAFAGAAFLLGRARLRQDALHLVTLCGLMLATVAIEGGDFFFYGRFIVPLLPLLYLAGSAGIATQLTRRFPNSARLGIAAIGLGLVGLSLLANSNNLGTRIRVDNEKETSIERRLFGEWASENTPADYTIAAYAVGNIGYYSNRNVLDLLGLNDVVIAHTDVSDFGIGPAGHEKHNVDYVLEQVLPEIIYRADAEPSPQDAASFVGQYVLLPASARLMNDPRLWELYDVRSIQIEGLWFNILQRIDTLD